MPFCIYCMVPFREEEEYNDHVKKEHIKVHSEDTMPYVKDLDIYEGNISRYNRHLSWNELDRRKNPKIFFKLLEDDFTRIIPYFKNPGSINVNVSVTMEKLSNDPFRFVDFGLQTESIENFGDSRETSKSIINNLEKRFEENTNKGSGLSLFAFNSVRISNTRILPSRYYKTKLSKSKPSDEREKYQ